MPDQTIVCIDCSQPFPFSEGEQGFYESKKLTPPKRCGDCRKARKAKINNPRPAAA